ncbi:unnamed protein product [Didymodactylos carnosus]|uniref:SET domain-containing protein n=1 Tax=Didymodactylos carnosus TaxID=1234261 RepID=A0A816AMP3_9BILA|nr:unnamed protein product [Didymodactylos carnosus]CAF4475185.1 unnamed protein product [Didymodactylos carnosus]
MLLVKTKVAPSSIAGLGLFAVEFIPKGSVIWRFEKTFDVSLSEENYSSLKKNPAFDSMDPYIYRSIITGNYIVCSDNARYINHSWQANTADKPGENGTLTIATSDIQPGEEITSNYELFDADFDKERDQYK